MGTESQVSFYLMKAEPDSRVVKGKDVKFSVDDFETAQVTAWEGVRNYEARNIMQEMKLGDKVLFYHSNTKDPGVAAYAEVPNFLRASFLNVSLKETHLTGFQRSSPRFFRDTAWDETHPYYDPKSDPTSPKWRMVELRFISRAPHFVPLALLRYLSAIPEVPAQMAYLNSDDLNAIKNMALLNKGRLSVQRVEKGAWDAISKIASEGHDGIDFKAPKRVTTGKGKKGEDSGAATMDKRGRKRGAKEAVEADETRKSKKVKR